MVAPGVITRGQRDSLLDGNSLRCRAVRDGDIDEPILQIVDTISRIGANPCNSEGLGTIEDAVFDERVGKSCDVRRQPAILPGLSVDTLSQTATECDWESNHSPSMRPLCPAPPFPMLSRMDEFPP